MLNKASSAFHLLLLYVSLLCVCWFVAVQGFLPVRLGQPSECAKCYIPSSQLGQRWGVSSVAYSCLFPCFFVTAIGLSWLMTCVQWYITHSLSFFMWDRKTLLSVLCATRSNILRPIQFQTPAVHVVPSPSIALAFWRFVLCSLAFSPHSLSVPSLCHFVDIIAPLTLAKQSSL